MFWARPYCSRTHFKNSLSIANDRTKYRTDLIVKLADLKYTYRQNIRDRAAMEQNFRQHFEELNRVHLTDAEFVRLLEQIITPDVFVA